MLLKIDCCSLALNSPYLAAGATIRNFDVNTSKLVKLRNFPAMSVVFSDRNALKDRLLQSCLELSVSRGGSHNTEFRREHIEIGEIKELPSYVGGVFRSECS